MQYDKENHVAWVHDQKVPLGADNAVLVDRVDRLHERPEVVRTLRVPSPVFTGGCPEGVDWSDLLRAHLEQVPEIQAFIRP